MQYTFYITAYTSLHRDTIITSKFAKNNIELLHFHIYIHPLLKHLIYNKYELTLQKKYIIIFQIYILK